VVKPRHDQEEPSHVASHSPAVFGHLSHPIGVLREHLLGPGFFDAEHHREIAFRSTTVRPPDDCRAEVDGDLTIRGVTRRLTATGRYTPPRPTSFGDVTGLELHTSFDRRAFGFEWQMELPGGGDAVGWNVDVDIDLLLLRDETNAEQ
jgi:polyisoprenoid-binding protein YceI